MPGVFDGGLASVAWLHNVGMDDGVPILWTITHTWIIQGTFPYMEHGTCEHSHLWNIPAMELSLRTMESGHSSHGHDKT